MNKSMQAPVTRDAFTQWLSIGGPTLQINKKDSYATVILLPKTDQIDYLFMEENYRGTGIHWNDSFSFCGLYSRQDKSLHIVESGLRKLVEGLMPAEYRDLDELREDFCGQVNACVEDTLRNDRNRLTVQEISDWQMKKDLEYYQEYGAKEDAIRRFFTGEGEDIRYCGDYKMEAWKEELLLEYIQDAAGTVRAEAERYIESHQEDILLDFLENDALLTEYQALMEDTGSPIHRMKAITDAVKGCGAKTVTVTVQKDGQELAFKAAADSLTGHRNYYSSLDIPASDRREFERVFGRYADYNAEDITKITYGRNTIYEAPSVQTEEMVPMMQMGGM